MIAENAPPANIPEIYAYCVATQHVLITCRVIPAIIDRSLFYEADNEPGLKEGLRATAQPKHWPFANRIEGLIRDELERNWKEAGEDANGSGRKSLQAKAQYR